jgi:hypothetical protein
MVQKEKKKLKKKKKQKKRIFSNVVAVAFQITFYTEMHANDVFLFFKNNF